MKASELITFLQQLVEKHGDLPIAHGPTGVDDEFEAISVVAVAGDDEGEDSAIVVGGDSLHDVMKDCGAPLLGEISG